MIMENIYYSRNIKRSVSDPGKCEESSTCVTPRELVAVFYMGTIYNVSNCSSRSQSFKHGTDRNCLSVRLVHLSMSQ